MVDFVADTPTPEAPLESAMQGYAQTAPSTTEALSSQFLSGPMGYIHRAIERGQYADSSWFDQYLASSVSPYGWKPQQEPLLQPDEINKRFAPPGVTLTTSPMSESLARTIAKQKWDEIDREGVWNRYTNAHGALTNFAAGTARFIEDPLNVASMFIPGVGEESAIAAFGRAGLSGAGARFAGRALAGATAGAAAQLPLSAVQYGLGREEASDYDLRSALIDVAAGGALGAAFHAGLGAIGDAIRGVGREPLQTAAAQLVEGRPIDVADTLGPENVARFNDLAGTAEGRFGYQPELGDVAVAEPPSPNIKDLLARHNPELMSRANALDAQITQLRTQIEETSARLNSYAKPADWAVEKLNGMRNDLVNLVNDRAQLGPEINAARQEIEGGRAAIHEQFQVPQDLYLQSGFWRKRARARFTDEMNAAGVAETDFPEEARALAAQMLGTGTHDGVAAIEQAMIDLLPKGISDAVFGEAAQTGREAAAGRRGADAGPSTAGGIPAAGEGVRGPGETGAEPGGPAAGVQPLDIGAPRRDSYSVDLSALVAKRRLQEQQGYAAGIPQEQFDRAMQDLYGPKPEDVKGPDLENQVAFEMHQLELTALTPEDHAELAAADAAIAAADRQEQAYAQAASCLTKAGIGL